MERFLGGNPNFVRIPFFHKFFLFFFNFSSYFHFDIFWDACFFLMCLLSVSVSLKETKSGFIYLKLSFCGEQKNMICFL